MICAPTGAGKTLMAQELARTAVDMGRPVMFIADRINLVDQTERAFSSAGLSVGRIQASRTRDEDATIVIASAATLRARRVEAGGRLLIVDEAHLRSEHVTGMLQQVDAAVGLTATPFPAWMFGRPAGGGKPAVEGVWDRMIVSATTRQLWDSGYLVEPAVHVEEIPDMTGADTDAAGEWTGTAAAEAVRMVDRIAEGWRDRTLARGWPCPTIVFGATVAHCEALAYALNRVSPAPFRVVSYQTRPDECEQAIRQFQDGRLMGLCSVGKLAVGFDAPNAECLIACRPLNKGFGAWLQQLGRVYRTAPGKRDALVLDWSGNSTRFHDRTVDFYALGRLPYQDADGVHAAPRDTPPPQGVLGENTCAAKVCSACNAIAQASATMCGECGAPLVLIDQDTSITNYRGDRGRTVRSAWTCAQVIAARAFQQYGDRERSERQARGIYQGLTGSFKRKTTAVDLSAEMARKVVHPAVLAQIQENRREWAKQKGWA